MLVVLVLVAPAVAFGVLIGFLAHRAPRAFPDSPGAIKPAARAVERELHKDTRIGLLVQRRTDPAELTGLFLTIGLLVVVVGIAVFGVVVFMVGEDSGLASFDRGIDRWAVGNGTDLSRTLLDLVTDLATAPVIVVLALVVLVVAMVRAPSFSVPLFLASVLVSQALLVELIKGIVDRVRPAAGLAGGLGPSFPSGHSATAAAAFAAFALVLSRRGTPRAQAWLVGLAVGIAVAVATTRVLLSVHWFTDALAGLAVGWTVFSLWALAFGGRLLHFGAPVEVAVRADALDPTTASARHGGTVHPRSQSHEV